MDRGARLTAWMRTAFVLLVLAAAVFAVWTAGDFRRAARLFPQYAGAALAILCVLELARQVLRRTVLAPASAALNTADIGLDDDERSPEGMRRSLTVLGWVLGFLGLIGLIGLPLATLAFVPAILWLRFRAPLWIAAALVAGLWALMLALQWALAMRLPAGLLTGTFPF
jgi:hypothetical protein